MEVEVGGERYLATYAHTFADVAPGELLVYEDAYRALALAVNRGDAAATLGAGARRRGAAAAAMIGTPRVHHRLTDSTNERAKELAARRRAARHARDRRRADRGARAPGPRAGRRRRGRRVLMSVVLRELDEIAPARRRRGRRARRSRRTRAIKWPNDVWIERRKLAGILVEGRPQEGWAVLGIGLNVARPSEFPAELAETATSLRCRGGEPRPWPVLAELLAGSTLARRAARARARGVACARCAAGSRCAGRAGRAPRAASRLGRARGRDPAGAVALDAGEVHLLR